MTDEELREIEERAAKATAEPWTVGGMLEEGMALVVLDSPRAADYEDLGRIVCHFSFVRPQTEVRANADFITHARSDVPALVAEVRRLQSEVSRTRDRAAQVAIDKGVGNGHMETCAWIADKIRAMK